MSKKLDREEDLIQRLEKENRELKKTNRVLNRRIKRLSRGYKKAFDKDDDPPAKPKENICTHCNKGKIERKTILNRTWNECSVCDYRTKTEVLN